MISLHSLLHHHHRMQQLEQQYISCRVNLILGHRVTALTVRQLQSQDQQQTQSPIRGHRRWELSELRLSAYQHSLVSPAFNFI